MSLGGSMKYEIDITNIIGVKVDNNNKTIKPDNTPTWHIPYYNIGLYGEIGYKGYTSLQGIVEDGFIENGYVYNIAKRVFYSNRHIKFIVIGNIEKYLEGLK